MSMSNERFTLQQLTPVEWIVVDTNRGPGDPYRTTACIYESDQSEYDVIWLQNLGLPSTYKSPHEVVRDIQQNTERPTLIPSRKPIPIPHRPPLPIARPAEPIAPLTA